MSRTEAKQRGRLAVIEIILLILIPVVCLVVCLGIGRMSIPLADVISSITGKITGSGTGGNTDTVIWSMRFPRLLLALIVGAGLSAAGCAFQSLFSNPLATPDTLGVASGASFGAALALLFEQGIVVVQGAALVFGLGAIALTGLAGNGRNSRKITIVLAGIIIGSLFSALVSFVKFAADTESQLPSITYWLMGSLSSASYKTLALGAPPVIVGIVIIFLLRWKMNTLALSDDEARSLGINVKGMRVITIICASLITASCVSMCGQVGWVGLLIPHICRMWVGSNHTRLIPAALSLGGAFMILVDTLARTMTAAEIPVSILTAILGAPFFIILMRKTGGWDL